MKPSFSLYATYTEGYLLILSMKGWQFVFVRLRGMFSKGIVFLDQVDVLAQLEGQPHLNDLHFDPFSS